MSKSQQTFNKREREKKRAKKKKDKAEKREARKLAKAERGESGTEIEFMYVDENGNLTAEKPDPTKKIEIKAEDIELGVPRNSSEPMDFVRRGKVKFYAEDKGYGFITDKATKDSIFFHINDVYDGIKENHIVTYEIGKGPKGNKAIKVEQVKN